MASIFALLILCGGIAWYLYASKKSVPNNVQNNVPNTVVPVTPQTETPVVATLYYPMSGFDARISVREFGKLVKATDVVSPCGAPFSGYHDADDLEVTPAEVNVDVPVYAVADGVVKQVSAVSGYGGLLVLGVTLKDQSYTVYYGHINLGSATLVAGSSVKAGQKLASLGAQCSTQTSGERKHLHFAMHKGATVDVRGYVPTFGELAAWIDPKAYLADNLATEIK